MTLSHKEALRQKFLSKRNSILATDLATKSQAICKTLLSLYPLPTGQVVAYFPTQKEVDIRPFLTSLLPSPIEILLPWFEPKSNTYKFSPIHSLTEVESGHHNMFEPKTKHPTHELQQVQQQANIWIVPGLAFDKNGHRIGRGKGYYDRFLEKAKGIKIGVCMDLQMSPTPIPSDFHDIPMNIVITESHLYRIDR